LTSPRLFFVRHAQTTANTDQVWHGTTDTELSEQGFAEISRLADHFHEVAAPDVIYTSPLIRTRKTAEAVSKKFDLTPINDVRLIELSMGEWEGMTYGDLHVAHDVFQQLGDNPDYRAPGGESPIEVASRMSKALDEIATVHPSSNVVVVSHGIAIAMTLADLLHNDLSRWSEYVSHNTAITEVCLKKRELVFFNRIDHLM
jgi:broad specificity phosphatase PhoE